MDRHGAGKGASTGEASSGSAAAPPQAVVSAAQDLCVPELVEFMHWLGFDALAAGALTDAVCCRYPAAVVLVLLLLGLLKASMERCVC